MSSMLSITVPANGGGLGLGLEGGGAVDVWAGGVDWELWTADVLPQDTNARVETTVKTERPARRQDCKGTSSWTKRLILSASTLAPRVGIGITLKTSIEGD